MDLKKFAMKIVNLVPTPHQQTQVILGIIETAMLVTNLLNYKSFV